MRSSFYIFRILFALLLFCPILPCSLAEENESLSSDNLCVAGFQAIAFFAVDQSGGNYVRTDVKESSVKSVFEYVFSSTVYSWLFGAMSTVVFMLLCVFLLFYIHAKKKEYQLGVIFNSFPLRFFVINKDGRILLHNITNEQPLLTGDLRTLENVAHAGVRQIMSEKTRNVIRTGSPDIATYAFEEGETRSALISRLPDTLFGCPAAIWISQDISELQKTRDVVKEKEDIYHLTLDSIGDGVISTDETGRIAMMNPVAERMIGVREKDAIGLMHDQVFKMIDMDNGLPIVSPIGQTLKTGEATELVNHSSIKTQNSSSLYHISQKATPIRNSQGNIIGVILIFRDVTEEYHHRGEMQKELTNWESAAIMANIYNFRLKLSTSEILGNSNITGIWPIMNGRAVPADQWIYPEDLPQWRNSYQKVLDGTKHQETFRYRVLQDGNMRYFRGVIRHDQKHSDEIYGLVQELTDVIREQKKLTATQELWSTCVNTIPAMIFIKSVSNGFRYQQCNTRFAEFYGRSIEEIIGKTDADFAPTSTDAEHFRTIDQHIIDIGKTQDFYESVYGADGQCHQVHTIKTPAQDMDGNPILLGISIDETEDHQLRMQLQTLLRNWDIASDLAQIVTYRINYKTMEMSGNKLLKEFWPIIDGKAVEARDWVYPPDIAICEENHSAVISGKLKKAVFVYRVVKNDGMHYYRIYIHKVPENPDEITGMIQDVTPFIVVQNQKNAVLDMWRKIVDSVPATFYIKDADDDFRYLQCSQNITEVFDRPPQEIVGHTDMELFSSPLDAKLVRNNDIHVMISGETQKIVELLQDPYGVVHRFESTKIPAKNEKGHSVLIGMTLEVTEMQELLEIRKVISTAFELLFSVIEPVDGIRVILKQVCDFIGFSRAYVSFIDEATDTVRIYTSYIPEGETSLFNNHVFPIDEARQQAWYQVMTDSSREGTFDCDFSREEDRKMAQIHVPGLLSKYQECNIRGIHVNYINVGGTPWGSVGFITQNAPLKRLSKNETRMLEMIAHIIELAIYHKKVYEKLEIAVKEAQNADKAKSFFLASMSHEIRTPLNAVIGFADLLRDNRLDPILQQEYLSNISLAGNALLQMVNDILDLSKLEAGQVVFVPEKTNMADFCYEIASLFSHSADQKNLKLTFTTADMPLVYIDQQRMRQILFNLVGNAIKFTSTGGVKIGVDFEQVLKDEGTLIITVSDTGVGVAPEDRTRLFEPFVQLTRMRGTNSANNGTGLGLPIVKKMLTQMGGTITLDSIMGKGSTFQITIPHIKMDSSPVTGESTKSLGEEIAPLCPPNEIPRILLVDDAAVNLKILSSMLTRFQVYHETASSGKIALEILQHGHFNIVLTDLVMSEMNGEDLARAIRANPDYSHIKIAVVTAEHDHSAYDRTLFDRIMEKPISRNALYDCIFMSNEHE